MVGKQKQKSNKKETLMTESKSPKLTDTDLFLFDWSGVISDDRPPVYEANMMLWDVRGIARINRDAFLVESRSSAAHFLREVHGVVDSEDLIFQEYSAAFKKVRESGYPPIVYPDAKSTLEKLINNGYWVEVI